MSKLEESIGRAATKIAEDIEANCIVSIEQTIKEIHEFEQDYLHTEVKVTIFRNVSSGYNKFEFITKIKKEHASIIPIKEILIEAINKKFIEKGDKVVCIVNESIGMGYKGLIFIFDVDKIFFNISTHNLSQNIPTDVIEAVINIASEISSEGREGKKIGTAFVIGDKSEILKYTKQLIINPFMGYPEDQRKITNPEIKETVKEFSQLDGAFIIDKNGTIITTGAYIDIDTSGIELFGLGTRHRNCAAITKATSAIAVVVSSSGAVRVFKEGKPVMRV